MKNDFREFYDKNYILHSMSEEEYIAHGEWSNNIRKYVDKVRTRSGKWKYIYPEDLKKKAENVKRDISYAVRNTASKISGKNKTFKKTADFRDYENKPHKLTHITFTNYNGKTYPVDDKGNIIPKNKQRLSSTYYESVQRQSRQSLAKYNKRREDQLAAEARNAITTRPRKKFKGTITELREQRAAQNQNALAIKKKRTYSNTVPSQFKKKRKAR